MTVTENGSVIDAVRDVFLKNRYDDVTAQMICARAGITRTEFDERWGGIEECFLEGYDVMSNHFCDTVFGAYESFDEWDEGFHAAAYAAGRWIRDNPMDGMFGTLAVNLAGKRAIAARVETVARFVEMVDGGREGPHALENIPPGTAERVLGSIVEMLAQSYKDEAVGDFHDVVPDLIFIAVSPYRGPAAAEAMMKKAPPPE